MTDEQEQRHAAAVNTFRAAQESLLASDLTEARQQEVLNLQNAAQEINTLLWEVLA